MSETQYVTTPFDLFKTVVADNEMYDARSSLVNARTLVNRIDVNIFQDEYAVLYLSSKWCIQNDMPLTREVLQQLILNTRDGLLESPKVTISKSKKDDERFQDILNYTLSEYDTMAEEEYDERNLKGMMNLYIQTWADQQMQQLIYEVNLIHQDQLRVGGKVYKGRDGANQYYRRKYEMIDSLVNERKDYLADDIDNKMMDGVEIKDKIQDEETDAEFVSRFGLPSLDNELMGVKRGEQVVVQGGSGVGKSIGIHTLLETPTGPVMAKDVKVGDMLFDRLGKPTTVTGVFPQGITERYKVTLSDGREMILSPDHLVPYITSKDNIANKELKEMFGDYVKTNKLGNKKHIYRIPQNGAVEFKQQTHDITSYALGVLIGDGSLKEWDKLVVTFSEEDVLNRFKEKAGLEGYTKNNIHYNFTIRDNKNSKKIREAIIDLGLNVGSSSKFIPEVYKYDSKQNRLDLLKGLMDTDGHVAINGSGESYTYSYDTISKKLAEDVKWVAQSLGYGAKLSTYNRESKGKGFEYRVRIYTDDVIVSSNKHLERLEKLEYRSNRDKWVYITDIQQIEDGETVCFSVDNPEHLFLMNDFIVTHNTRFVVGTLGYNALMMGFNVLHVSLEQKPSRVYPMYQARHIVQQLGTRAGLTDDKIRLKTYDPVLEGIVQESFVDLAENQEYGRLKVVGRDLQADNVDDYLNTIYDEFQFDVVIIDYFGLIGTKTAQTRYAELAGFANDIKSACKYFRGRGFLAVIPNQLSTDVESKLLKGDDTESKLGGAGSQDLLRGSDYTFTLYETSQLKEDAQVKLLVDKQRSGTMVPNFMLDADKGRSLFLEHIEEDDDLV